MAQHLYIVDGSSYVFRAYYASPPMSTSKGFPTNGLFVFTNMLLALMKNEAPDLVAVTFDTPKETFRKKLYEEYKANRATPPDDLAAQFPFFSKIVEALGYRAFAMPGYEADDIIASLTKKAKAQGVEVTIVSADKDLMQLIEDGKVRMLDTMSKRRRVITEAEVLERFQVKPSQVADVLALAGDTSDNVPGIPGVGPKTAGKLVAEFGDLPTVLASVDKISGKKRKENLTQFASQARLSLELVRLIDNLEIDTPHPRSGAPTKRSQSLVGPLQRTRVLPPHSRAQAPTRQNPYTHPKRSRAPHRQRPHHLPRRARRRHHRHLPSRPLGPRYHHRRHPRRNHRGARHGPPNRPPGTCPSTTAPSPLPTKSTPPL